MMKIVIKANNEKGSVALKEHLEERNKMSLLEKAVFNRMFKLVLEHDKIELVAKNKMVELVDKNSLINQIKNDFLEKGCKEEDFNIEVLNDE